MPSIPPYQVTTRVATNPVKVNCLPAKRNSSAFLGFFLPARIPKRSIVNKYAKIRNRSMPEKFNLFNYRGTVTHLEKFEKENAVSFNFYRHG